MSFSGAIGAVAREMVIRLADLVPQRQLHHLFFLHGDILYLSTIQAAEMGMARGEDIIARGSIAYLQGQYHLLGSQGLQRVEDCSTRYPGFHLA